MAEEKTEIDILSVELISKGLLPQPRNFEGNYYSFDYNFQLKAKADQKLIFTFLNLAVRDEDKKNNLATFVIVCIFHVPEYEKVIKLNQDNLYNIPDDLDLTFKSATMSTARGIVYAELRGTYLHGAVIPLIDPKNLKAAIKNQEEIIGK